MFENHYLPDGRNIKFVEHFLIVLRIVIYSPMATHFIKVKYVSYNGNKEINTLFESYSFKTGWMIFTMLCYLSLLKYNFRHILRLSKV